MPTLEPAARRWRSLSSNRKHDRSAKQDSRSEVNQDSNKAIVHDSTEFIAKRSRLMSYEVDYAEVGGFYLLPNQTVGVTVYWTGDLTSDIGPYHWFRLSVILDPEENLIEDVFDALPQSVQISKEFFTVDKSRKYFAGIELTNPGPTPVSFVVAVLSTPSQY
jgi:hypothetical protein